MGLTKRIVPGTLNFMNVKKILSWHWTVYILSEDWSFAPLMMWLDSEVLEGDEEFAHTSLRGTWKEIFTISQVALQGMLPSFKCLCENYEERTNQTQASWVWLRVWLLQLSDLMLFPRMGLIVLVLQGLGCVCGASLEDLESFGRDHLQILAKGQWVQGQAQYARLTWALKCQDAPGQPPQSGVPWQCSQDPLCEESALVGPVLVMCPDYWNISQVLSEAFIRFSWISILIALCTFYMTSYCSQVCL